MARISQIMANDERFGGVVTDEEWNNADINKHTLFAGYNGVIEYDEGWGIDRHFLAFHSAEARDLFMQENMDLICDYLMIIV